MVPKSLVEYVTTDSSVRQVMEKMRFHRYAAFPVLDKEGTYVGAVRLDDVFRCFSTDAQYDLKSAEHIGVLSVTDLSYKPVRHDAQMEELIDKVKEHNFVAVVDDRGCFIGIILRRDILNYLLQYYITNEGEHRDPN